MTALLVAVEPGHEHRVAAVGLVHELHAQVEQALFILSHQERDGRRKLDEAMEHRAGQVSRAPAGGDVLLERPAQVETAVDERRGVADLGAWLVWSARLPCASCADSVRGPSPPNVSALIRIAVDMVQRSDRT